MSARQQMTNSLAAKSEGETPDVFLFLRVTHCPWYTNLLTYSYVAALELRIEKLEKRLAYARSRKASVALHDPDAPPAIEPSRKDSLAFIRAAIHRKAARNRENSDVNSLVSDFGYLCVSFQLAPER